MADMHLITPSHPQWSTFVSRLSEARICHGTTENARAVLSGLPGIDAEGSLHALAALGGTCDCAIEFDVAPRTEILRA